MAVSPRDAGTQSLGEPVVRLERVPGRVELRLSGLDALFDPGSPPTYPHTGPMLEKSVAKFLVDAVREQRGHREFEVVVTLDGSPLAPEKEVATRAQMSRFFTNEEELASLDLRVNRAEGLGSLRYSIPLVAVALLIAGLFYSQLGTVSGAGYLATLSYLVFITIVWLMLWDPLELLLFDSFFIRQRIHALRKLAHARVTFTYRSR